MTENEAKAKLERTSVLWESATNTEMVEAVKVAIKTLEEIQQYRAIGTVEGYERAIETSKENYLLYAEYKSKLQEFESIGTIEEFKDLKEKSVAKKVDENECCPICYTYGKDDNGVAGEYCPNCGQKLDWEGKENV